MSVLRVIARHGLVLATGHLSRDEIFAVVDAAREEGVQNIVITHPDFPSQDLSVGDQSALAARGALLERCFTTPHTGKVELGEPLRGRFERRGPSTRCSPPISGRRRTHRSRTGSA